MCGIAGELSWNRPPDLDAVRAMRRRLAHRGPDAEGEWSRGPVALGHTRLTVIDLSPASDQPLSDAAEEVWIVYNGEIYNFRELRRELERAGTRFRTEGDTEAIVEAYKRWGTGCLERLNGMFAFALWDARRERLLLARDRTGQKPLYYFRLAGGGLAFASDLRSLRAHPEAPRAVDPVALSQFLSLNYTLSERPILAGIERLAPASYLVAEREGTPRETRYWDLAAAFGRRQRRPLAEAARELDAAVDDAVRLRLVADVPLGAFLSGGLDSSVVVESMCRARPAAENLTFSIGFEEASYSELAKARRVAGLLGVDHHERTVRADAARHLGEIVELAGEPFADSSILPTWHLARFARERVTVALSGDGGDEALAGYETYRADRLRRAVAWVPGPLSAAAAAIARRLVPVRFDKVSFDYKLGRFLEGAALDFRRAHHHWRVISTREEKRRLLRPAYRELADEDGSRIFDRHFDEVASCHWLDQAMYVDVKTWLADDILVKVDRATMAHSLEARSPFLDHRLLELAASLPPSARLRGLTTKYLLKRAGRGRLPDDILDQPKEGFGSPVSHWLAGELGPLGRRATGGGALDEWIEPAAVERLWREHGARRADHGLKLFGLTCLALWLEAGA